MIEDYLAVKRRIKERNFGERVADLDRRDELEETLRPVVTSNERLLVNLGWLASTDHSPMHFFTNI